MKQKLKRIFSSVTSMALIFTTTVFCHNNIFGFSAIAEGALNEQTVPWLEVSSAENNYKTIDYVSSDGNTYTCYVYDSTENSAVLISVDGWSYSNYTGVMGYDNQVEDLRLKGARMPKFAEYQILTDAGQKINGYTNFNCQEYEVCWYDNGKWHGQKGNNKYDDSKYHASFDINRNPIKTVSASLIKNDATPTLSSVKGVDFTWQGDCEIELTYYDIDKTMLDKIPTDAGNYYVKASVPLVVVTENGANIRYEASESNYIPFKIKHDLSHTELKYQSCTEDGNHEYYYCNKCDKYFSDSECENEITLDSTIIAAKGHSLTVTEEKSPTCINIGNIKYWHCSECDKYFSDSECKNEITLEDVTISATGHSFTNYVSDDNAACTKDGTKTAKCDNCDETDTITVEDSATGHSFTNYVSDDNATCTKDGTKTAKCDNCDETDTITDEDSAAGHSFTNYVSDDNATCTKDGTKTAKCDNCDETDTITDKDSATGHSFTNYVSDDNATCTKDGTKTAKCDNCDETDTITDEDSAAGHSFTNYVSDNNAACTKDGTKTAKCDNCDETDTITDKDSATGHSFTNYVSNGDATYTENGTKTAKCDNCDETDTKIDENSMIITTVTTTSATTSNTTITTVSTTHKQTTASTTTSNTSTSKNTTFTTTSSNTSISTQITVITTTTSTEIPGDINGDGKVTISDIVIMQRYLCKPKDFPKENFKNFDIFDINKDNKLNVFDLIILKRLVLNK